MGRKARLRNDPTTQKYLLGRKKLRIDNIPARAAEKVTSNRQKAANRKSLRDLERARDKHASGCAEYKKAQRAIDQFLNDHEV